MEQLGEQVVAGLQRAEAVEEPQVLELGAVAELHGLALWLKPGPEAVEEAEGLKRVQEVHLWCRILLAEQPGFLAPVWVISMQAYPPEDSVAAGEPWCQTEY